ncbi:hypothetical protein K1719_035078 [Acacia pycnantha]|nr:hypothetical protein K1719_035078 [Acacia pycnantha]
MASQLCDTLFTNFQHAILIFSKYSQKLHHIHCKKWLGAMGAARGQRLSGMQKQVLSLYRGFLRAARSKPEEERCKIESVVSEEFRHNCRQVDPKSFIYIEYLLRRGKKQLDQLRDPGLSYSSQKLVDMNDYVTTIPTNMTPVFVVGVMAHGKVETDYTDEFIAISGYPLSAAYCLTRICAALEGKWKIL